MRAQLKPAIKNANQSILVKNDKLKSFYAPHHYHPDYEIIYIKKSYGLRIVGNHIDNYQAGEVVILGPELPHFHQLGSVKTDDETPIETIAVLFPPSIIENNLQFPEFEALNHLVEQIKYGIELSGETKLYVQQILEDMSLQPCLHNFLSLFKILEVLAMENSSYNALSTIKYDNKKLYNDKTKPVLDYISNNYLGSISIKEAGEQIGMSESGFCNFFKTQMGVTFSQYINKLRISKACELLATTEKNVSEIAYQIGYENLAYFNRRFKETKGMTPKSYRSNLVN